MEELPPYQKIPEQPINETVAKSISRESAFSKPGSPSKGTGKSPGKGMRFRPMSVKNIGRKRKRPIDPRRVTYY